MNETTKTSLFLALAVVLVAAAFIARPIVREVKFDDMVGKPLFPQFTDPLAVKQLEIVRLDSSGNPIEFRVAEVNGVWSIPSHDNYPADAKEQMGKVAEALDLQVLDVLKLDETADKTALHTMYGVIDPTSDAASLGEGIGVKVKLGGSGDETFVDLIVGKEADAKEKKNVEDPDEKGKLRYVRIAGQTPVYIVEIEPARFSTNFDQWIETNLLDINTMDLKQVFVDEYSSQIETELVRTAVGVVPQPKLIPTLTGDMLLGHNGSATGAEKWTLEKLMSFDRNNKYIEASLKPDEELDTEVLDGMVSALNDLKIVSVTKKPSVFADALKSGQTLEDIKPDPSLQKAGFYLVSMPDLKGSTTATRKQLLSNEGDIQLRMKDGIRYNLRFGDLTGTESEIDGQETESKASPTMGVNRYLFITAAFDSSMIPPPDVKPIPEVPTEGEAEVLVKAKAEKEQIERSNKREEDRYKEAVEAGQKRVKKLTEKFADWYYVIPEDVYKKVHLSRATAVREKKKEDAHDPDDDHDHGAVPPKKFPTLPGMDGMLTIPGLDNTPKTEEKTDGKKKDSFDPFGGDVPK